MSDEPVPSLGIELRVSDMADTPQFTALGGLFDLPGLDLKVKEINVTAYNHAAMEYISSKLLDGGSLAVQVYWTAEETQQTQLEAAMRSGVKLDFEAGYNDPGDADEESYHAFAAIVTGFHIKPAGPGDDAIKATITLRVSGNAALTVAS